MSVDLLIRGGTVVDGTGSPARPADVAVTGGRVVAIGPDARSEHADRVVDADGLAVTPGFVDLHTHYDAQILWDPSASPSPAHGVTTVFGGNCGFGLAPVAPEHTAYLAELMARVEGIPLPALRAGVPWDWAGFGDYLDALTTRGTAVNAGFLVGHSAVRRLTMGEAATGERATPDQVADMAALVRGALESGAFGFSSSRAPTHHDGNGDPVPSRAAAPDELLALAAELAPFPGTQLELILPGCLNGFTDDEVDLMTELALAAASPLNWNVLGVSATGDHERQLAASTRAAARGATVVALTIPQSMRIRLSFLTGFVLDGLPGWADVLGRPVPERLRLLADPAVRARLDAGAHAPEAGVLSGLARWERFTVVEGFTPGTRAYEGRTVGSIAAETGRAPFDVLCDIVVADGLRTGLRPELPAEDDATWRARAAVWRDPRAVVGASDAGAHLDMFCMAGYSTFLVGPAVRDLGLLGLEEAVRLLTDVPARLYGLTGRGRIAPGAAADLVLFDPATVGPGREHTVDDLPGGSGRIVVDAVGVERVLVAGADVMVGGAYTGARPGAVLRRGRST